MQHRPWSAIVVGLASAGILVAGPAVAQLYVYPQKGQSPPQQQQDQGECHVWAMQQSGYNPTVAAAPPPPPPPSGGGAVGGAARGAAVGAVGGAIAGDAGKGAAVGAATGAVFGTMRRNNQNRQYQAQVSAQQSQVAGQQANYNRALAACLTGRGYTVQ
jgi:predicted lipid-binding transport protein (Tim44 family)